MVLDNKKLIYILGASIVVTVFIVVILIVRGIGGSTPKNTYLEFWGAFDSPAVYSQIIREFEKQNPGVKIVYRQFSYEDYEKNLVNAMAAGTGPDILMFHNSWLPKHGDKLKPLPEKIPELKEPLFPLQDFKNQFVDVAYKDFVFQDKIYALPLYVDTLALYYNKDLFNTAGITRPPQTWQDFNQNVEALTKLNAVGEVIQAGATLGTARNINRSTDILQTLMIQSGVPMTNADNTQAVFDRSVNNINIGQQALQYYTDFANPTARTYTWNDQLHYSVDAFTEGTAAMMINYSYEIPIVKSKASRLNFAVAPMPQASLSDIKNFSNYWGASVSTKSEHPNEAWQFIVYLTGKTGSSIYLNATLRPSARRDLIELQKSDSDLGVFALQSLTAKSWYQIDNVAIETIFADMIDAVNFKRSSIREALQNAESKVNVLMMK